MSDTNPFFEYKAIFPDASAEYYRISESVPCLPFFPQTLTPDEVGVLAPVYSKCAKERRRITREEYVDAFCLKGGAYSFELWTTGEAVSFSDREEFLKAAKADFAEARRRGLLDDLCWD